MPNLKIILFLIASLPSIALADTTVIIKRHSPRGLEQASYQFTKTKIIYITNSNFTQPSKSKALLGAFHADASSQSKEIESKLIKVKEKIKRSATASKEFQVEISIDGLVLPANKPEYNKAMELVKNTNELSWIADEGVEAMLDSTGKVIIRNLTKNTKSSSAENCLTIIHSEQCEVIPYGLISLKKESYEKE